MLKDGSRRGSFGVLFALVLLGSMLNQTKAAPTLNNAALNIQNMINSDNNVQQGAPRILKDATMIGDLEIVLKFFTHLVKALHTSVLNGPSSLPLGNPSLLQNPTGVHANVPATGFANEGIEIEKPNVNDPVSISQLQNQTPNQLFNPAIITGNELTLIIPVLSDAAFTTIEPMILQFVGGITTVQAIASGPKILSDIDSTSWQEDDVTLNIRYTYTLRMPLTATPGPFQLLVETSAIPTTTTTTTAITTTTTAMMTTITTMTHTSTHTGSYSHSYSHSMNASGPTSTTTPARYSTSTTAAAVSSHKVGGLVATAVVAAYLINGLNAAV